MDGKQITLSRLEDVFSEVPDDGSDAVTDSAYFRAKQYVEGLPETSTKAWVCPDDFGGLSLEWRNSDHKVVLFVSAENDERILLKSRGEKARIERGSFLGIGNILKNRGL